MLISLKNILFLINAGLLLNSCTPEMFRGLEKAGADFTMEKVQMFRPGIMESLVYKTNISYEGKEFSALTYFNELADSVFKVVLLTTFGNTLLEAEISKEKFTVNNVVSYLNRKPLLKLLENDWRLMLAGNLFSEVPLICKQPPGVPVFVYRKGQSFDLYHFDEKEGSVTRVESYRGRSKKAVVQVESFRETQPERFSIEHPSLDLKLSLSLLKKVSDEPVK